MEFFFDSIPIFRFYSQNQFYQIERENIEIAFYISISANILSLYLPSQVFLLVSSFQSSFERDSCNRAEYSFTIANVHRACENKYSFRNSE